MRLSRIAYVIVSVAVTALALTSAPVGHADESKKHDEHGEKADADKDKEHHKDAKHDKHHGDKADAKKDHEHEHEHHEDHSDHADGHGKK